MEIFWDFANKSAAFESFNNDMDEIVRNLKDSYHSMAQEPVKSVVAAVSGGSDSLSLLIFMANWAKINNIVVKCVTVDHQLRSESRDEALFVRDFCKQLEIEHTILNWNHSAEVDHGKLENLAREARYKLIKDFCKGENIHIAAVGHNWNDQLETFEMRKEQNSGEFGLAGMSRIHSIAPDLALIRPVLHFTKQYLKDFLTSENISWKEDPMNQDENFKRVFYRKNIGEKSRENLLQISHKIFAFGEKRKNVEKKAVKKLNEHLKRSFDFFPQTATVKKSNEYLKRSFDFFPRMIFDTPQFLSEEIDVQTEILKRMIWNIGGKKYPPKIDAEILHNIFEPQNAGKIFSIGRCSVRANKKHFYVFRENRNLDETIAISRDKREYIFDNRFLISITAEKNSKIYDKLTKCVITSVRNKFEDISSEYGKYSEYKGIPANAFYGFPCIIAADKKNDANADNSVFDREKDIVFAYGLKTKYSENHLINCEFINKVNLFDVFL